MGSFRIRCWLCAGMVLSLVTAGQAAVSFSFVSMDGSVTPGSGKFFDPLMPDGPAHAKALMDTASLIGGLLGHTATVTVLVSSYSDPGDSTLASAGGFFFVDPATPGGFVSNGVQKAILAGELTPGPIAFLSVNAAKSYYSGVDPAGIGGGDKDLRSVFLHEFTHMLGWASAIKPDGSSGLSDALADSDPIFAGVAELYTIFDSLLVDGTGKPLIKPDTGAFNPLADMGTGVYVAGPTVLAGGADPLPSFVVPGLFHDTTHLMPGFDSIMGPTLADGAIKRAWTEYDVKVLADLGYTIVPEPLTVAAWMCGLAVLRGRRRCRSQRSDACP